MSDKNPHDSTTWFSLKKFQNLKSCLKRKKQQQVNKNKGSVSVFHLANNIHYYSKL